MWPSLSVDGGNQQEGEEQRGRRQNQSQVPGTQGRPATSCPSAFQESRCPTEPRCPSSPGSGILRARLAVPSGHLPLLAILLWAAPGAQNSFVLKGLFTQCQSHHSGAGQVTSLLHVILTVERRPSCAYGRLGAAVGACAKKPGDGVREASTAPGRLTPRPLR